VAFRGGGGRGRRRRQVPALEDFDEAALGEAAALVEEERQVVKQGMGHAEAPASEYHNVWLACYQDILWLPSANCYGRSGRATLQDRLDSAKADLERARSEMAKDAKRASKLEQKVNLLCGGFAARAAQSQARAAELYEAAASAGVELAVFQVLHRQESAAGPARLEALQVEVATQKEREKVLQVGASRSGSVAGGAWQRPWALWARRRPSEEAAIHVESEPFS